MLNHTYLARVGRRSLFVMTLEMHNTANMAAEHAYDFTAMDNKKDEEVDVAIAQIFDLSDADKETDEKGSGEEVLGDDPWPLGSEAKLGELARQVQLLHYKLDAVLGGMVQTKLAVTTIPPMRSKPEQLPDISAGVVEVCDAADTHMDPG